MNKKQFILNWMREQALPTGSKYFYGEGVDEDYVCTFDDLRNMDREYPYTAQIITNQHDDKSSYGLEDGNFFSAKIEVDEVSLNIIVTKPHEFMVWKYATEQFTQHFYNNDLVRRNKALRVKIFSYLKEKFRSEQIIKDA